MEDKNGGEQGRMFGDELLSEPTTDTLYQNNVSVWNVSPDLVLSQQATAKNRLVEHPQQPATHIKGPEPLEEEQSALSSFPSQNSISY